MTTPEVPAGLACLSEHTALGALLQWAEQTVQQNLASPEYQEIYLPICRETAAKAGSVFLSVVIRTQGRRSETLREALLSLDAQTDRDFEVLLMLHKVTPEEAAAVEAVIAGLPQRLQQQIRTIRVECGNRSTPINYGFAHAHGQYVAILDDDDTVLENWVACYHAALQEKPGTIAHAYVLGQPWEQILNADGTRTLRPCGSVKEEYCQPFRLFRELEDNYCPLMGLAFPRSIFTECGFLFDDARTTAEDWDFLMRTMPLLGVTEIPEPTCLYRHWSNTEDSHAVHRREEWLANRNAVADRVLVTPFIVDGNTMLQETARERAELADAMHSASWKVGRIVTWLPRQLREARNALREDGLRGLRRWFREKRLGFGTALKELLAR